MYGVDKFVGSWTYRSFINEPDIDAPVDGMLFAMAGIELKKEGSGSLLKGLGKGGCEMSGQLSPGDLRLIVSGTAQPGDPPTIRFRATGVEGTPTAGWIYDYVGYLTPAWPKGVGQRPAIVGTVIRTVPHKAVSGDAVRPAGVTASFIAVSRDHPADS
jgi:hypothetical protein